MNDNLVLKLLIFSILLFVVCLFVCEQFYPNDGQIFQVVAGLVASFSGAFLMFIKNKLGIQDPPPPGTQRMITTDTSTVVKEKTELPPS